ncbi:MAG: DUF4292 domain-containing protein [Bacteroidales bacterium]
MRKITKIAGLVSLLMALTLTGCKSKQGSVARFSKDGMERVEAVLAKQFEYETFVGRVDLALTLKGKRINSKAEVRMIKDRYIQVSVQPLLGIEVARLTISPDTLLLIDRMGKRYVCEEISKHQQMLPEEVNFAAMQQMIANQIFDVNRAAITSKDIVNLFEQKKEGDLLIINSNNGRRVDFDFMLNNEAQLIQTSVQTKTGTRLMDYRYEDFRPTDNGGVFPYKAKVQLKIREYEVEAAMNFSNVSVNKRTEISMAVPNRYNKMKIEELLSVLLKK